MCRKDFNKKTGEFTLIAKSFDAKLIKDYSILLNNAFSFQFPPPEDLDETIKYFEHLLTKEYFIDSFTSFWKKNQLIGFYWINENLLDKLVIAPQYQRCGYGTFLLTHALQSVFSNGDYEYAHLDCMLQNERGLRFYNKYGLCKGKIE